MRSTLDGETRIISIALGHDITAAYDTKSAKLFKLWQGKAKLSGAVYDETNQAISLKNGHSRFTATYIPIENPLPTEQASSKKSHPGLVLINNSDCAPCHNPEVKTVGPAYLAIAQRYGSISNTNYTKFMI